MHLRDSVVGVREEVDKQTDLPLMSAGGKKRHLLGNSSSGGGGARKKATISPSHERPYSLRSFLKPMDRVAVELDSGDEGKQQHCEPVDLEDSAEDESDAAVCFKRKRSLRLKNQLSSLKPEETTTLKANAVGCSKRRRADASQKHPCEQDREPSVILAWKHWCMYEEDGEEIDVLVNKRDERRRLERKNEPLRQEQKQIGAADSTKIEAPEHVMSSNNVTREEVKDDSQNLVVTESGASHVDKRAVVSGDLRSLTGSEDRGVQVVSGEGAEGSNTPAGIDSKLRKSPGRDSDIEIASASVPADRLGGLHSRASSTQALIIGDQQTDPSFFSAQEDSMVLDTIAEGVAAITSYESISQSTLNDICTKGKAIHESGTSYCGRHGGDALIVDLDEQQDGTAVEKLDAGDSTGAFGVPDSVPESSNQQHPPLTSEQDWGQSSGSAMRHQVQEEQGESIGEPNEVAQRRRSKQKVVELSDEEEDSNRVSIERRVLSGQHSHHGLTRSYGGATTSGAEISSVDVAAARFATSRHPILAEHLRLVDYDDTDGGTVESNAPFQASVGVNDADLDAEQVKTYRRRRSRNQGKAIAGEDSGEEVRCPTTRQDGETSDVDSHEGQLGGELPPAGPPIFCPVCDHELEPGMSNERINDHIDKCLRRL